MAGFRRSCGPFCCVVASTMAEALRARASSVCGDFRALCQLVDRVMDAAAWCAFIGASDAAGVRERGALNISLNRVDKRGSGRVKTGASGESNLCTFRLRK